jgi:rhodanese-related sulfurtransferase
MKKSLLAGLCLLATVSVNAQYKKPSAATPSTPAASPIQVSGARQNVAATFPRVSMEDAYKLYTSGKAVFIDVRGTSQFEQGHIKGSLGIPGSQLVKRFLEVPAGKTIITYCACSAEQSSGRAASDLIAHGVKNVYALKGGWSEWKAKGYPTAVGPT